MSGQIMEEVLEVGSAGGFIDFIFPQQLTEEVIHAARFLDQFPDPVADVIEAVINAIGHVEDNGLALQLNKDVFVDGGDHRFARDTL
jgi:hypothetical protein